MANEITATYHSTQPELYAITRLGWQLCSTHRAAVILRFPEYTETYITDAVARILAAETLPDFQARDNITETDRILLKQLAEPATDKWNLLRRYITRAYQSNIPLIKPNLEAAGLDYYEAATRENPNWEDLKAMLKSGSDYITAHTTLLTPVMYANFPTEYEADRSAFLAKYAAFTGGQTNSPAQTKTKILANNGIHADLMLMLGDLTEVFKRDLTLAGSFTFANLKRIISSPGPAGLRGTLTNTAAIPVPIAGATLHLVELERTTTSDDNGKYAFGNMPAGTYTLIISAPGYVSITVSVTIPTGTTSTKDYQLTAV